MPAIQSYPQWSPDLAAEGQGSVCEVSFEDVTVDFSQEEWQHLDPVQQRLYWDVTLETYSHLCAVGYQVPKPEVIFRLEQGEGSWTLDKETPHHSCSGGFFTSEPSEKTDHGAVSHWKYPTANHLRGVPEVLGASGCKELQKLGSWEAIGAAGVGC
ncbi:zinc finger protein 41 isoform X3 [Bos mutus]|uniref:zinc finger protein 41 isoform X3 n=1 Tax=Bos mutus TaxID=72004 RepID=UPI0038B4969F